MSADQFAAALFVVAGLCGFAGYGWGRNGTPNPIALALANAGVVFVGLTGFSNSAGAGIFSVAGFMVVLGSTVFLGRAMRPEGKP